MIGDVGILQDEIVALIKLAAGYIYELELCDLFGLMEEDIEEAKDLIEVKVEVAHDSSEEFDNFLTNFKVGVFSEIAVKDLPNGG